ncbi:glucuronoxylan 4-O-methyltransferase 1-like [Andrographis paniculata]|uniref:glucuronoxylan 4-O-methyltransferase 1-like n=1 Tax=Andrographis paniculata TaxID=175694 RepID=UPI0021E8274C|nr:glucuronoxylan 4-O-methyltransferase 1-like [Andrographis paniculata]
MRSTPYNPKLLLIFVTIVSFFLFIIRSNLPPSNPTLIPLSRSSSTTPTCNKIPTSISEALIYYSTSTITPQQTLKEIAFTARILDDKSPCNFLVFGLGHDNLMWRALNHGGRTVFLEEDRAWIGQVKKRFPGLEAHHVVYDTKVSEANELMQAGKGHECTAIIDSRYSMCQLALRGLPGYIYDTQWDVIMVDAPTGYHEEAPGRMAAIYTAGMMARNREDGGAKTHIFVHDINRDIEDRFSREFLCEGYMRKQVERLRHFVVPSHKNDLDKPFCPLMGNL